MHRYHRHGRCGGHGYAPFGFHHGPWAHRGWGFGFPRREDYAQMLQTYKEHLEEAQQQIAEELEQVQNEIDKLTQ
jgi:hypothetical protein